MNDHKTPSTRMQRAQDEQRTLTAVIENSSDFIGIATPDGDVLYLNRAGQALVGYDTSSAVLRAMTIYDFHPCEDAAFMRDQFVAGLLRDGHWEGELRLRHLRTGAPIPAHASACLIRHPRTHEPVAIAMIGRTERKRMEEALRESEVNPTDLRCRRTERRTPCRPQHIRILVLTLLGRAKA